MGNRSQPGERKNIRAPGSQTQLLAQVPLGMRLATSATAMRPAPTNAGHGPCAYGRSPSAESRDQGLHGWLCRLSQRPPHAQSCIRHLAR
eukprot:7227317-Heterocapsa_arctica.AAC.1